LLYIFNPAFSGLSKINTQKLPKFSQKKLKKNYLIFSARKSAEVRKNTDELKNKKGKVEIVYSSYIINKGLADSLFN
jgi:hypothetical protein